MYCHHTYKLKRIYGVKTKWGLTQFSSIQLPLEQVPREETGSRGQCHHWEVWPVGWKVTTVREHSTESRLSCLHVTLSPGVVAICACFTVGSSGSGFSFLCNEPNCCWASVAARDVPCAVVQKMRVFTGVELYLYQQIQKTQWGLEQYSLCLVHAIKLVGDYSVVKQKSLQKYVA